MVDAFLIRVSPRYKKGERLRGTLIDPSFVAEEKWEDNQRGYYDRTFKISAFPSRELDLEFGQPPRELVGEVSEGVGSLAFLVIGADSSQGSDNERGMVGVGTIAEVKPTAEGSGASRRLRVRVNNLVYVDRIIDPANFANSKYFLSSGLGNQTMFGWKGSSSAQNAVPLHDRDAKVTVDKEAPVLATLALMTDLDEGFATRFEAAHPALSLRVSQLPEPPAPVGGDEDEYIPPEVRQEPIDANEIYEYIESKGYAFEPWQVAAFVAAVRTKPFVILTGISGTGKTQLPLLVAEATGAFSEVASVRPDWTDSSELLGYTNLSGEFVPGQLMEYARAAMEDPDRQHFFLLDEMNIARTEYYLAEVLSVMERRDDDGNSAPLMSFAGTRSSREFSDVVLPSNLTIIGSVNVDESTYEFSRKVLDRAFVLEFNSPTLDRVISPAKNISQRQVYFSSASWRGKSTRLGGRDDYATAEGRAALELLLDVNAIMNEMRLGVGYRVRDEFISFILESNAVGAKFVDFDGVAIDPANIAVVSKLLPRIAGPSSSLAAPLARLVGALRSHDLEFAANRVVEMEERGARDSYVSFF